MALIDSWLTGVLREMRLSWMSDDSVRWVRTTPRGTIAVLTPAVGERTRGSRQDSVLPPRKQQTPKHLWPRPGMVMVTAKGCSDEAGQPVFWKEPGPDLVWIFL